MRDFVKANYHAHTMRCQHAYGTEREFIEAAIKLGIEEFGFSDHIPCPYKDGFVSGIRMRMDQAEEYRDCIRRLAEEYKDQIRIYAGFEAEYIPRFFDEQMKMFDDLGFDYLIMGQHFLDLGEVDGAYTGAPTRDEAYFKSYVDTVIEGMKTGAFLYVAHPDILNYQGPERVYEEQMGRLCRAAREMHIPLEINVLGMDGNRQYPSGRFWSIASRVGNDAIYGLDAHAVEHIRAFGAYERCVKLAERNHLHILERLEV